jgi:hypothetical protein
MPMLRSAVRIEWPITQLFSTKTLQKGPGFSRRRMATIPTDTFSAFKPIIFFVKCFGLAPYSVTGETGSRLLQTSVGDIVYSIFFIAFSTFLVIYYSDIWQFMNVVTICSVSEKVIACSVIIQFVLSAFVSLLKRHTIVNIANQLASLNASLKRSCGCVWKKIFIILLSHLFISLLSVASCFVSDMFARIRGPNSVMFITFNVLTFACFLTEFQIVGFLMLLKQLISDLNNSIRDLGKIKGNKGNTCSCSQILPLNSTAPVFVTSAYEKLQQTSTNNDSHSAKVILLRDIQDSLCGTSETLNSAYSFLLLYTSAKTFVCLTHNLYFILLRVFMSGPNTCGEGSPYAYYMWFLHYSIKLVWLVFYSSSAIQQVSQPSLYYACRFKNLRVM